MQNVRSSYESCLLFTPKDLHRLANTRTLRNFKTDTHLVYTSLSSSIIIIYMQLFSIYGSGTQIEWLAPQSVPTLDRVPTSLQYSSNNNSLRPEVVVN